MASYKPPVVDFETSFVLTGEAGTEKLGARIAGSLGPGDLVALSGGLGAGKTTLARAILRARGVTEHVPSPSFTLVQRYQTGQLAVYHYDLYRLSDVTDLVELGLDDALDDGAALVEWPEHGLPNRLRRDALLVSITATSETGRRIGISGPVRWRAVLEGMAP